MKLRTLLACTAPLLLALPTAAQATTELVANGFSLPLWAGAPAGDARVFVIEQNTGRIEIVDASGAVLPTPFLDIGAKISAFGERGLLGMAFHPNYAANGHFFVNYTVAGSGATRIERYTVSANPNVADPTSAVQLMQFSQPFSNHNGGGLAFGPDGYLYIATGDGGSGNDPFCNAQDLTSPHGKMLRLDVDSGSPYAVPADNPFVGQGGGVIEEIYHVGLRNPFRFSFDSQNGDLWIGDVGQDAREEINRYPAGGAAGANFGWKMMEGNICNSTSSCSPAPPPCNSPLLTDPVHTYNHGAFGGVCTVIGGHVYHGSEASLQGMYLFADYCTSDIWMLDPATSNVTEISNSLDPAGAASINSITSFGEDGNGEVLIVDQGGEVWRIVPTSPCGFTQYGVGLGGANIATLDSASTPNVGASVTFDVAGYNLGGSALFVLSSAQASIPVGTGTALISLPQQLLLTSLPLDGAGAGSLGINIPNNPNLAGFTAFAQSAQVDGSFPGGFALSNGLSMLICP